GFHNISFNYRALQAASTGGRARAANEAFDVTRGAAALLIRYAADMGIEAAFVAQLLGRPSEEMRFVDSIAEFIALQACPVGAPPQARLDPRQQALNICINAAGLRGQFEASQAHALTALE